MPVDLLLRAAYAANVLILLPVVAGLLLVRDPSAVFGPAVPESAALRLLVASLWGAILVCSLAGLAWPRAFAGVLVLQVVYKAAWLVLHVAPTLIREPAAVPWGPAAVFVPIVLLWPLILARLAAEGWPAD